MLKLHRSALLVAALALALSAGRSAAQSQTGPAAAPPPTDPVVATVDGDEIRLSEVTSAQQGLPQQYRDAPLTTVFPLLLNQVVERRLVGRAAVGSGIDRDPEVAIRLARAREGVLVEAYMTRQIGPMLTEEKLRDRYDSTVGAASGEEEVRARHILVESEQDALAVLAELNKGRDFAEVAKERSTGPSGPQGGDLGFFQKGAMVPEFSESAFALRAGQVSQPVKTQFGWHVIKVEERRAVKPPSFEESVENLRNGMAREIILDIVERLRKQAKIQMFNIDGTPQIGPTVVPTRK